MAKQNLKSNPIIRLVDEVTRLQGRIKSLFDDVHKETGLKTMEDVVLTAIAEADTPPTVPQIGRSLGHPRQVIQRAVNDLLEAGYLQRLNNPDHKRAPLFMVTAKGLSLKAKSDAQALAVANAFLQANKNADYENLAQQLQEVRRAIERFSRDKNPNPNSKGTTRK